MSEAELDAEWDRKREEDELWWKEHRWEMRFYLFVGYLFLPLLIIWYWIVEFKDARAEKKVVIQTPEAKRNYEWRSIPEVLFIEVTRDGDVRYQKGKEKYDSKGALIDPRQFTVDLLGSRKIIQQIITKAFPDIPMRHEYPW
jgi:hypothetical protein